ncbi:MAG: bifunctional demethylmenaquinone methyltransferase/2-methoxy-6-polyprenyl-1,4-benzoquinol methylase UbiE [Bacteroidota bacterium]|nr:bifunctional demethylmenaquinone methyltransferase/2-methoxy-6-polyprenyl-1,4-benzoquinol methylase UbiE [Bacteroidota bacterium]
MVKPDNKADTGKKEQVQQMFDDISPKYDLLNRVLSLGIDIKWRKRVVEILKPHKPSYILDVATGTADLAISMMELNPSKIVGVDISQGMLNKGKIKLINKGLDSVITLQQGDSENLNFVDNTFDAITVAFGVRNYENLRLGLSEMLRVLKPEGILVILEFSQPKNKLFGSIYRFYFNNILPAIGKLISKNAKAYTYLPQSVGAFPYGDEMLNILNEIGYKNTKCEELTMGIASIYEASK